MINITGGTISKERGSSVTFKVKCDKCGYSDSLESTITVSKGVTEVATRKCSFCGNNQVVKIKRVAEQDNINQNSQILLKSNSL